jgi:hypothetical protein
MEEHENQNTEITIQLRFIESNLHGP